MLQIAHADATKTQPSTTSPPAPPSFFPRSSLLLGAADYIEWWINLRAERLLLPPRTGARQWQNFYLWKSCDGAEDEVSVGEITVDRAGDETFLEHLSLHIDTLLTLFGIDVYRRIEAMRADDDPIPLTVSIDLGSGSRAVAQAPSASQRRIQEPGKRDRRA